MSAAVLRLERGILSVILHPFPVCAERDTASWLETGRTAQKLLTRFSGFQILVSTRVRNNTKSNTAGTRASASVQTSPVQVQQVLDLEEAGTADTQPLRDEQPL